MLSWGCSVSLKVNVGELGLDGLSRATEEVARFSTESKSSPLGVRGTRGCYTGAPTRLDKGVVELFLLPSLDSRGE